jgi:ABC-2 type transport system ATP-binding protein
MKLDDYAVVAEGLTKRFGDFTAVDHIDFAIPRGVIFGFLGPNGSGKTTTIRMLLGLLAPSEGTAHVLGFDIQRGVPLELKRRIGYMSQKFTLYNDLTVEENLNFYGRTYGLPNDQLRARKQTIVEMAGLTGRERELTRNLAGGWKQRLALGTAIVHEPELLFLDEPTAGVDPVSRRAFWNLLYRLAHAGTTIFVTTHYMDEAEHCQRLAFIHNGRIVAQGTPADIKTTNMQGQVLEVDCDAPDRAIATLRRLRDDGLPLVEIALYGAQIHAVAEDIGTMVPTIESALQTAGIQVYSLAVIPPSLEDVFISSVRDRNAQPAPGGSATRQPTDL